MTLNTLTLISLAVGPCVGIAVYIYWKDRFDKEPRRLMLQSFFLGMLSIFPAVWLEKKCAGWLGVEQGSVSLAETAAYAYLVIGLVEELFKFFFTWNYFYDRDEFNEPYDGITYAVMVSMGFATLENVFYVLDDEGGYAVAILRMFTAVPAHASFAVIMGYFMGLAKFNPLRRSWFLFCSIAVPVFFHGTYDFCLLQQQSLYLGLGTVVTLVLVIRLSYRAIRLHQQASPYNPANKMIFPDDEKRAEDIT